MNRTLNFGLWIVALSSLTASAWDLGQDATWIKKALAQDPSVCLDVKLKQTKIDAVHKKAGSARVGTPDHIQDTSYVSPEVTAYHLAHENVFREPQQEGVETPRAERRRLNYEVTSALNDYLMSKSRTFSNEAQEIRKLETPGHASRGTRDKLVNLRRHREEVVGYARELCNLGDNPAKTRKADRSRYYLLGSSRASRTTSQDTLRSLRGTGRGD